jgi:hypothetical protein
MLLAGQDAAEAFYRITDAAYERRSVAVTSNIHPSGFDSIMPKTLATATVDNRSRNGFVCFRPRGVVASQQASGRRPVRSDLLRIQRVVPGFLQLLV